MSDIHQCKSRTQDVKKKKKPLKSPVASSDELGHNIRFNTNGNLEDLMIYILAFGIEPDIMSKHQHLFT